jgi:hypothetical protein
VQNVDLGCMQINWRWHAAEFVDAASMMDPATNTRYSARFLRELHDRFGDWDSAVAAYHSADATRGAAYGRKVEAARERFLAEQSAAAPALRMADSVVPVEQQPGQTLLRGLLALSGRPVIGQAQPGDLRQARGGGGLFSRTAPVILNAGN